MEAATHRVLASVWPSFAARISRIRKAAAKLGTQFELSVGRPYPVVRPDGTAREYLDVTVCAEVPQIAGWSFAAAIDHADTGNLLRTSPRFAGALPASFRTDGPTCDHCRLVRARNTTYALINGAGEFKRVGSGCLVDFVGHGDAVALVEWAATLAAFGADLDASESELGESCPREERLFNVPAFVALAFRAIKDRGAFISGKQAGEQQVESTKDRVLRHLFPAKGYTERDRFPAASDSELADFNASAAAAVDWVQSEYGTRSDLSDFEYNLLAVVRSGYVKAKHLGIVAYIAEAYRRHLGEVASRASGAFSEYIGVEGAKVDFEFVLTGVRTSDTHFGTVFYFAGTSGSNRVTIKGSNEYLTGTKRGAQVEAVIGRTYRVAATIKRVEEFQLGHRDGDQAVPAWSP